MNQTPFLHPDSYIDSEFTALPTWTDRLALSRKQGRGFAAPGGEFTRALTRYLVAGGVPRYAARLQNSPLIELGAGMYHYGFSLATLLGCSRYTGVEPFYDDCLEASITTVVSTFPGKFPSYHIASEDMLSYLRRCPDESGNIMACGIERCILPDDRYARAVGQEIARVIGRAHLFFAAQSDLSPSLPILSSSFIPGCRGREVDRLVVYGREG